MLQGHPDESSAHRHSLQRKRSLSPFRVRYYPIPQNPIQIKYLNRKIDLKPRQCSPIPQANALIGHRHKKQPHKVKNGAQNFLPSIPLSLHGDRALSWPGSCHLHASASWVPRLQASAAHVSSVWHFYCTFCTSDTKMSENLPSTL